MADQKLTELTVIQIAKLTDIFYVVTYDDDGNSISRAITAEDLFNSITTGTNRVISGQVFYTGTGFTFESYQLTYEVDGQIYYSHGDQVTCSAPDATNPRLDVIFADANGLDIKEGTPAATPAEPTLDNPTLEVKTNLVLVSVGASAPTEISLDAMYLENAQEVGGEWDTAESTSGVRIDLASTINPITGTYSIRASIAQSGDYFELSHSTAITIADFDNLRMTFRSLGKWKSDFLSVEFRDGGVVVGATAITGNSFPTTDTVTSHDVYLVNGAITWVSGYTEFDEVRFIWKNKNNTSGVVSDAGFLLDDIYVQHGGDPTTPQPTSVLASKVWVDTTNFSNNLSSSDTDVQEALETLDALAASSSPLTTKGDIWSYSTSDGRFPVGANDKFLKANSTETFGLEYDYIPEVLIVAFSDESSVVTAGTTKVSFQMPNYATTLTDIAVNFKTAPTTSAITIDVNEGGTSVLSTKITVDATETSSETAATPPVISDSSLAANAIITVDVDTADSGGTSVGGKLIMYFNKA